MPLAPVDLATTFDLDHRHSAWTLEYDNGRMDGFDREPVGGPNGATPPPNFAYSYVPQAQVQPYWAMAKAYAFADRTFATNEGPSFPAHLYLATGSSAIDPSNVLYAMDNPRLAQYQQYNDLGGCDSTAGAVVPLINPVTGDQGAPPVFPCFEHQTIWDLLDASHLTWKWYQPQLGQGLWFTPDAIKHIRYGSDYANVSTPNTTVITDIQSGRLPNVSWVIPTAAESDHPGDTDGSGPAWVSEIVNALGSSRYWNSSAVFVIWDDWGGWYDHVAPTQYNKYELGFRVPMIAISPYARAGYVSHAQHEFGSILKFLETNYGLPSLHATDERADALSDMFDLTQSPLPFHRISAPSVPGTARADKRVPDKDD